MIRDEEEMGTESKSEKRQRVAKNEFVIMRGENFLSLVVRFPNIDSLGKSRQDGAICGKNSHRGKCLRIQK